MRPPHGLHAALTRRYTMVTVSALLIVEILGILVITRLAPPFASNMQPDVNVMQTLAATTATYLEAGAVDELNQWLSSLRQPMINLTMTDHWLRAHMVQFPRREEQILVVFREQDGVVAITPATSAFRRLRRLEDLPGPLDSSLLRSVPAQPGANGITTYSGSQSVSVTPVQGTDGTLLGVLILLNFASNTPPAWNEILVFAGISVLILTLVVGILGAIFSSFASRFLVQRMRHLARTTAAWGVGDFSTPITGNAVEHDEIDQLAQHLNRLRTQIQALLDLREQWAVLEERNRVARELHDSVKQYMFTIRMHLATAQALVAQGNMDAERYIWQAMALAQHAQDELSAIIHVFHTAATAEADLPQRVRELVARWSHQTRIAAVLDVSDGVKLPVAVEHALVRVLQEALANVYKHSGARQIRVRLAQHHATTQLTIEDDGAGFDPAAEQRGLGLRSMRERIESFGGRLRLRSDATGTRIDVAVDQEVTP